ncbi:MAG: hypothetical protein E2O68_01900, partial [Deltaproteobacteria bacterium]
MGAKFPPLVLDRVTPADGAIKVFIRPRIELRFNNQIDITTLLVNTSTTNCLGSVQLSKDNFVSCENLVPPISYDGGFSYEIWAANNLEILTNYKIKVTEDVKDTIGHNLTNPYLSTFGFITEDNVAPEVESTSPPPGAPDVAEETPISITFTKPINPNTVTTNIIYSTECSGSLQVSSNGFFSCVPMDWEIVISEDLKTFTIKPFEALDSETFFQIRALQSIEDLAGNNLKAQYVGAGFKVKDWIAPTVTNTFPQQGAVEVRLDTPIIISFSELMDTESITVNTVDNVCKGSIQLILKDVPDDSTPTCVQFISNPSTTNDISFIANPKEELIQGSLYEIKVTSDAQDLAGNGLDPEASISFSTVARPYVISTIPTDGAYPVPYDATITVNFNKSMDASSVFTDPNSNSCDVATLVVQRTDGTCVPLQVAVASNSNRTFTTKPVMPFDDQDILKIKVADTVRDPLG